ncbi:MAG: PIG-L family deacetylase [Planctomycetes bacterium]|nr:PIG-L family deacetylase [Planctomycetota bacterium]MBI3847705.1 PIG-L family deacetylase [Planctomycetota bacterium]
MNTRLPEPMWSPEGLPRSRVVVFAPHPDDEVVGCGGLLVAFARRGDPVRVCFLTDGCKGGFHDKHDDAYVRLREGEAAAGLLSMGVADFRFWRFHDQELGAAPDLAAKMSREAADFGATAVLVTSPFEIHPDHRAACRAAIAAFAGKADAPEVWFYEVSAPLTANVSLDITSLAAAKKKALECHASQLAHNDYVAKMEGYNRYRTVNEGRKEVVFAESYLRLPARDLTELDRSVGALLAVVDRNRPA